MKAFILIALLVAGAYAFPSNTYIYETKGTKINDLPAGTYLKQGDILVKKSSKSLSQPRANSWTNGQIPYLIDPAAAYTSAELAIIKHGMDLLTQKTSSCVTFVERTTQTNYIKIKRLQGCYSYLGMIGGEQEVSLGNGCVYAGTVVHELMHALGYEHEQNRQDRDQYITVNLDNVSPDARDQFTVAAGDYYGTTYDLLSIMQYGEYAFSFNGQKTIIPKDGSHLIEAYDKTDAQIMTASDISAVRQRYQCTGATTAPTTVATTAATTTGTTTTGTTTAGVCENTDSACSYFASEKATYCAANGVTYTLNGRPFRESCRLMCGLCTSTVPCNDKWFCSQFSASTATYCSSTGTVFYINGEPFRQACPVLCDACNTRSVHLTPAAPKAKLGKIIHF